MSLKNIYQGPTERAREIRLYLIATTSRRGATFLRFLIQRFLVPPLLNFRRNLSFQLAA